tara:strand:- start:351 stop:878 length:528 start_codon:yes stop_codon:yes gene_type:complete
MSNYNEYIRTIPDYPVEGINFYDLNSLFASNVWPRAVRSLVDELKENYVRDVTHIVGIESRGFVVGAAMAQVMQIPFVMVRKKGAKYPGKLLEESYELEYGTDTLTLQEGILGHTSRVIIADDLVATGGSMMATKRLIEQTGSRVLGGATVVNLKYLNPESMKHFTLAKLYEATF